MAKTAVYLQRGEAIDYVNSTEAAIPAGTVVIFGKRIGIAGGEIPVGELCVLHMTGVFEIPKKSGVALAAGDEVTFTDADGIDKATAGAVGHAVEAAEAGAATAKIKLLG